MRNIISTNSPLDAPEEYGDAVRELIDGGSPHVETLRETYQLDEIGQKEYRIRVVRYPDPDAGQEVWAVDYSDPASREVEESTDPAEAVARYLELVRSSASMSDEPFYCTDVPGVPARMTAPSYSPRLVEVDITDALRSGGDGANWAEIATERWVREARRHALDVEVASTEVDHADRDAAVVCVTDVNGAVDYVIEVRNDTARAVTR